MKKTMLYFGWGLVAFGICLLCLGWFVDDRLSGVFNGFAGAMLGVGIGNLIRWNRIQMEPDSAYARKFHQTQIEEKDERNRMIRERSGYFTMYFLMLLLVVLGFGFQILDALEIRAGFSGDAAVLCSILALLTLLVHYLVIWYFNKKL